MKRLLCSLGFHKWKYKHRHNVRECECCPREEYRSPATFFTWRRYV